MLCRAQMILEIAFRSPDHARTLSLGMDGLLKSEWRNTLRYCATRYWRNRNAGSAESHMAQYGAVLRPTGLAQQVHTLRPGKQRQFAARDQLVGLFVILSGIVGFAAHPTLCGVILFLCEEWSFERRRRDVRTHSPVI
jgi:hypothetical protein